MASKNKFEEMLERLVNEDQAGAEELFHEIVVEKSRDIYESLLESDIEIEEEDDENVDEASDEEVDESDDEEVDESDDEEVSEDFDLDEFEVEGGDMDMMGGDPSDMDADMGMDDAEGDMDMDMDDEGEEEIEDRVEDLEDALDELKAEFEAMMADGDEGDDEEEAEEESFEFEAADEEVDEASDEEVDEASDEEVEEATDDEVEEGSKSEAEQMREYVEKITATMGDNGDNTKSPVASKNDMGGDASNLVAGGEADTGGTGAGAPKEDSAGNVNVPGGKAAKANKNMPKGHGAEKKGAPDGAANKKPVVGG